MRHALCMVASALLISALTVSPALAEPRPNSAGQPTEWVEVFAEDGTIQQVKIPKRAQPRTSFAVPPPANVTALQQTGPSAQRFDLVFVGDGYTSSELGLFHAHAAEKWAFLQTVEPFRTYKNSFNVWMVDVISPQSGVDNDPTQGISRNTALGMGFWCGGTERLLCVNENAARAYAANAPQADQILALGNSTKYGGAGGGVATASGGNTSSGWIVAHELGHSMADLADEYDYPYGRYTGGEPYEQNVSVYPAETQRDYRLKWYQHLGQPTPDGGVIGTYEGARYYLYGIYRPSENSLMRSLGRPFNTIGLNAMIRAIRAKTG
ncbi:M64 family metallopeptidase [Nonomuraea roseoviolacea subsp. roseoviolacea]|uniref:M64 family metallopeptidase n=1 Tax=Nonomuraea roseoviolacea TaxID=103837 RepID=UPI0031D1F867